MKNTLTIAITKYYTFKTDATDMGLAFDEYSNTNPRLRYKDMTIEPVEFNLKTTKTKDANESRRTNQKKRS